MKDENDNDLVERTTEFALRVVRMFVSLRKTEEAHGRDQSFVFKIDDAHWGHPCFYVWLGS